MSRGDDVVIEVKEALKSLVGGKWVASYLDIRLKAWVLLTIMYNNNV